MRNAFSNDLNRGYVALKRLVNGLYGAEQIVKATLETLLIKFIRDIRCLTGEQYRNRGDYILYSANTPRKEQHEHIILGIQDYIINNMHKKLSIDTICREFNMCRSSVNRLFRTFHELELPILLAVSRKSSIGTELGNLPAEERLEGTLAVSCYAAMQNIEMVRVHDVLENKRALAMIEVLK
jgi:hypothetical protein